MGGGRKKLLTPDATVFTSGINTELPCDAVAAKEIDSMTTSSPAGIALVLHETINPPGTAAEHRAVNGRRAALS